MKRFIKVIFILVLSCIVLPVHAENYKIKELIPKKVDTTIRTDSFIYKGMYFDNKGIHFNGIKNRTEGKLPISISIGLFNKSGKNIGTINYCDSSLEAGQEMSYIIKYNENYFAKNMDSKDIKYIAVLSDNINCRKDGSLDYVGKSIDKLGVISRYDVGTDTELLLIVLGAVGGILLILFIYHFLFTNKYSNFDGNDVRGAYKKVNEDLAKEREEELKRNPPTEPERKSEKSEEVLKQEEEASKEDKSNTDLHNMYK